VKKIKPFLFLPLFTGLCFIESLAINSSAKAGDGCGQKGNLSYLVPNNPTGASFQQACNHHDDCYDTPNAPKAVCDKKFHEEMLEQCARTYHTLITKPLRRTCNRTADIYYTVVLEYGDQAYRDAQNAATKK
jgi:hypothetical protein